MNSELFKPKELIQFVNIFLKTNDINKAADFLNLTPSEAEELLEQKNVHILLKLKAKQRNFTFEATTFNSPRLINRSDDRHSITHALSKKYANPNKLFNNSFKSLPVDHTADRTVGHFQPPMEYTQSVSHRGVRKEGANKGYKEELKVPETASSKEIVAQVTPDWIITSYADLHEESRVSGDHNLRLRVLDSIQRIVAPRGDGTRDGNRDGNSNVNILITDYKNADVKNNEN